VIQFDGLEDALLGIVEVHTQPARLVYDYDKILEILQEQGMTYSEAEEYFGFNIGCLWAGETTPAIFYSKTSPWFEIVCNDYWGQYQP
jgi:hypothetical protein